MEAILAIVLPLVIKYAPGLIKDIQAALEKEGYTVAEIDAIFAAVKPYDELGIDPNAPVKPE